MKLLLLTDQQFHHTLAGLRALQYDFEQGDERWADIATCGGEVARMMPEELDDLCETINCTDPNQGTVMRYLGTQVDPADQPFIDNALESLTFSLEYDDTPLTSRGDDGCFVNCWVWVSNEDAGIAGIYTE